MFDKVLNGELEETNRRKERGAYAQSVDSEFKMLCEESDALKNECERLLKCGVGDEEIGNRVQAHLTCVTSFFRGHARQANSPDAAWSLKHKTHFLERLKELLALNVRRTDEWLDLVIDT